jgi:hypothetical protein
MVKVRIPDCGPTYLDGFFLGPDGDYTLLSPKGGQGKEDLTFRGPGPFSYLDRARMTQCAFSLEGTIVTTWTELWESSGVRYPVGSWYDSSDSGYVRVIDQRSRRLYKINQTTRVATALSGALFSHYAGGLSGDPSDATIYWVLEAPWAGGSAAHSYIHKVRKSDNVVLASFDIGTDRWTGIKAAATHLWLTNYDDEKIYNKSKTTGADVGSRTITYKGVLQVNPTGVSVNGTKLGYWFNGKGRILIADVATPGTIERVITTTNLAAFGGDWVTILTEDFLFPVTNVVGRTYKYQLTDAIPACAGIDGIFHPLQQTPGSLAWRVLVEITHVDRPDQPCPELTYDFTEDEDSNGTTWPARTSTEEFTWKVGDRAFSDVLARLIPAGVTFDLDVNTMVLHAYVDAGFGTDRTAADFGSGKVRFVEGVNLAVNADLAKRDNRGQPASNMTVAGENGVYGSAELAGRYVREGFMAVTGTTTSAVLDAIGADELARQRLVAEALGFETLWQNAELAGGYIPKKHYWKGDLVRVDMEPGEFAYDEADLRVYGTLISERDGGWRAAVDLGSAYKVPPPISSVPGTGSTSGTSSGGGASSGSTTITQTIPLVVEGLDDTGEVLTTATGNKIRAVGAQVFQEAVGVIRLVITAATRLLGLDDVDADDIADKQLLRWDASSGTFVPANLEDAATAETDAALVYAPDGAGGVVARPETGGGTGGAGEGAYTVQTQNPMPVLQLSKDGTFRDPLLIGTGETTVGAITTVVDDTKYNGWPQIVRLRDGRPFMVWTKPDNHNLDNSGKIVGMLGAEALDGEITWSGTEIVIADDATLGSINAMACVLHSGRLVISYNLFDYPIAPVDAVRVVWSDDYLNDFAGGFSAPYTVNTSFTGTVTAGSGRFIQLSDGTVVLPVYGLASGGTFYSAAVLFSTDDGETFGGELIVANGPADSRQYYEPTLTLVALDDGTQAVLLLTRTSASTGTMYQQLSTDGCQTFTAPAAAFAGYSPGNAIQLSSRTVISAIRGNAAAKTELFVNVDRSSWPWAWDSQGVIDTSGYTENEYACPLELLNGNGIVVAESVQPTSSLTNADLKTIRLVETTIRVGTGATTAADVAVVDAGAYFTGTEVEAVLQEIGADLATVGGASRRVLMRSGATYPPDPLVNTDGSDWLYGVFG